MGFCLLGPRRGQTGNDMQTPFDIVADLDTPVSAYLKLGPLHPRYLLESVEGGERLARYSFLGFGEALEIRMDDTALAINGEQRARPESQQEYLYHRFLSCYHPYNEIPNLREKWFPF